MAAIICELCGSNDIQKQDGVFVCQHCGTKYSLDEAKKLLGTVRVDNTQKVDNLFTLARRAKSNNNSEDAEKYYDLIRQELPDNWEANFYAVYYRARNCKIGEIAWAGNSISNCIHSSFEMIKRNLTDDQERITAVSEISQSAYSISEMLDSAAHSHYDSIDESIRFNYYNELSANTNAASKIKETVCDELCLVFGDDKAVFTTVGFKYVKAWIKETYNCEKYIIAVQKYEPDYVDLDAPRKERERQENIRLKESMLKELDEMQATLDAALKKSSGSGCYIATAVYGSYDCPEVWTLRRFRDYTLAQTWYGRLFIQVYYAVSPTLVKWFGNEKWFKRLWKPPLDRKIKKLNSQGVPNTPYFR